MSQRMTRILISLLGPFLAGFSIISGVQAEVIYPLSPESIKSEAKARGAKPVVRELYRDGSAWSKVITSIASGKNAWIDVAVILRAGSDAGSTSMLRDSLFEALKENPDYVLSQAVKTYGIDSICSGRVDPLPTYKAAISEVELIVRAVGAVRNKDLAEMKNNCLEHLERSQKNLRRFFGVEEQ